MVSLPDDLFQNPVLTALQTTHAHLACTNGNALRYLPYISPFAALAEPTPRALDAIHALLTPGDGVWLAAIDGIDPSSSGLKVLTTIPCHQMMLPDSVTLPNLPSGILQLNCSNAHEMVALTDAAFPGFFRARTCEMGAYFGIRSAESGELIAMAGERMTFPGYAEISGICTHPHHRGQGYAAALTRQVVRHQREQGIVSWLHVAAANLRAVSLYRSLGFEIARTIPLTQISRH